MKKGYLGLEIGEKLLRYVFVNAEKDKHVLSKAGQVVADLNLNTTGSLSKAVLSVLQLEAISPKRIFVTISRRDTLVHQQLMPRMSNAEMEEVIPDEIEKIPSFYNQTFEYCYKSFPHSAQKERVVFAAVADPSLRSMIEEIDTLKIPFHDIEISPLNLKEILPSLPKRCEAVLVIQEFCSYLCIYKGQNYLGFYRSPIGSEQILSPVTTANRDHIVTNWMGEFERALKSYLLEENNAPVEQLWLVGDSLLTEDVAEKISQRLYLNTEIFKAEKINNFKIENDVEWNPAYAMALTPVLLHLREQKPVFPLDHFFTHVQMQKYTGQLVLKTIIFLLALFLGIGWMNRVAKDNDVFLQTETKKLAFTIENLNKKNADLFAQKDDYLDVRKKLLNQASYVQEINRTSWTKILAAIANELPSDLSLTGFKFSEAGDVNIKGDTFDITTIANLIRRINQSSILESGKFDFLNEKKQQEVKLFNFGIQANLKDNNVEGKDNKVESHGKEKN